MLRQPRSLRLCTLIDKPQRRKIDMTPDYNGFEAPDRYVVGYGLGRDGQYQNLPCLTCLEPTPVEGVLV
jgi:hypoxanthine phosphoribosyltransferase